MGDEKKETKSKEIIDPFIHLEGEAARAFEEKLERQKEFYRSKHQLSVTINRKPVEQEEPTEKPSLSSRVVKFLGIPSAAAPAPAVPISCQVPVYAPPQTASTCYPVKNRKATAYDLMEIMKQKYIIRVKDQDVYFYLGTHYQRSNRQTVQRLIMYACRDMVKDAGSGSIVDKAYALLLIEPELAVTELSTDRDLVSFENGVLRLSDGCLMPHSPDHFTTYVLACNYIPQPNTLPSPHFDHYLDTATGGDEALMLRILQFIGYCLVPDVAAKIFFLLQGVPSSGKSMLTNFMQDLLPREKVSSLDVHDLNARFSLSNLEGTALCVSSDLPAKPLDAACVSHIKKLTGDDVVSADKKYGDRRQFRFEGTLILVTNYPLLTAVPDPAFTQRVVCIPYLYGVPNEKRDTTLRKSLFNERAAIVSKAIAAYFQLRQKHYCFSGNYEMNAPAVFAACQTSPVIDTAVQIAIFLQRFFIPDEGSILEMAQIHKLFCQEYGSVPLNSFSSKFSNCAAEMYGCQQVRSRLNKYENPHSCVKGLRMREITDEGC